MPINCKTRYLPDPVGSRVCEPLPLDFAQITSIRR